MCYKISQGAAICGSMSVLQKCSVVVLYFSIVLLVTNAYKLVVILSTCFFFFLLQVESTQTMIRIVGLSATLPNYLEVFLAI